MFGYFLWWLLLRCLFGLRGGDGGGGCGVGFRWDYGKWDVFLKVEVDFLDVVVVDCGVWFFLWCDVLL